MAAKRSGIDPPIDLHPSRSREANHTEFLPQTSFGDEFSNNHDIASRDQPPSPTKSSPPPRFSPSAAMAPSRAGTLSWQQRPASRASNGVRSRPTSVIADRDSKPSGSTPESPSAPESEPSRSQIAQSLQSKDPAWFRQTAERGLGSAAYRRNAEDAASDTASMSGSMRLPGMSRESTAEVEKVSTPGIGSERSPSPSRTSSIQGSNTWSNRYSSQSSYTTTGGLGSPMPLSSAQRFEPKASETSSTHETANAERLAMSPSQGRISPERPASPTKGLGGFVQSAMLKRSDSVNKRWSTQAPVGLSRGNSIASNRSGYGGSVNPPLGSVSPPRDTRPLSRGRESSPLSTSRPTSSHSNATVVANLKENERLGTSGTMSGRAESTTNDGFVKPPLPLNISRSSRTPDANSPKSPEKDDDLPVSPSKTMDPKRWSPTKSSWLESAINKPTDSPKPKAPPSQQPSWVTELNKSKQEKGSVEPVKTSSFKEVTTGGLLRSPPMGGSIKPLTIGGYPEGFSSGIVKKSETPGPTRSNTATPPFESLDKTKSMDENPNKATSETEASTELLQTSPTEKGNFEKQTPKTGPFASVFTPRHDRSSPTPELKLKPDTPPKKQDFRANLKPRQPPKEDSSNKEPEFKNALGKLKRTQTKNYVAPNELKDNILRGKSGLNLTGGPKKTQRVDEFKESLLKQKDAMKTGGGTLRRQPTGGSDSRDKTPPPVPEALAKRQNLGRSNSNLSSEGSVKEPSPFKSKKLPEADELPSSVGSPLQKSDSRSKPTVAPKFSPKPSAPSFDHPPVQASTAPKDVKESHKPPVESSAARRFGPGTTAQMAKNEPVSTVEAPKTTSTPTQPHNLSTKATPAPIKETVGGKLAGRLNPALAGILSRGPPAVSNEPSTSEPTMRGITTPQTSSQAEDSASGKNLTHMTKARAKGPKRRLPTAQAPEAISTPSATPPVPSDVKKFELASATLTDETATSSPPKSFTSRPLPTKPTKKIDDPGPVDLQPPKTSTPRPLPAKPVKKIDDSELADLYPPKTSTPRPLGEVINKSTVEDAQFADLYPPKNPLVKKRSVFDLDSKTSVNMSPTLDKSKPVVSSKSPLLQRVVSPPPRGSGTPDTGSSPVDLSPQRSRTPGINDNKSEATSQPLPRPTIHEEDPDVEDALSFSNARGRYWGRIATTDTPKQQPSRAVADDMKSEKDNTIGLGLRSVSINSRGKEPSDRPLPTPPTKTPISLPTPPTTTPISPPIPKKSSAVSQNSPSNDQAASPTISKKSGTAPNPKVTHRMKPSITSPIPRTSDAQRIIFDFFDEAPNAKAKLDFDTQAALASKTDSPPKITTMKRTIWEINGDGKRQDMPPHQDYILFEECMYLIVHNYTTANGGKGNEVTLWCGDGVGEAAIEDAQLFCRKVARENSTKLTVIKQGRETGNFIQALGGILITRRRQASSMYMLCCRQHQGQIVFDEVDLTPSKLCSAFPYIISAKYGKLYLWKGKGSTAEELGCSRLIGMGTFSFIPLYPSANLTVDLGLTGEFEEISEEEEPLSFFDAFPDSREQSVPKSSQNWAQRPSHPKYGSRLFRIDHSFRQSGLSFWSRRGSPPPELAASITEIDPFWQSDLEPQSIYVLDAFFEIYV
jgi:hypothetical protein